MNYCLYLGQTVSDTCRGKQACLEFSAVKPNHVIPPSFQSQSVLPSLQELIADATLLQVRSRWKSRESPLRLPHAQPSLQALPAADSWAGSKHDCNSDFDGARSCFTLLSFVFTLTVAGVYYFSFSPLSLALRVCTCMCLFAVYSVQ